MKKLPSLHILNGDASLKAFETAKFPGQLLIWREILSEGPAIGSLSEPQFWQKRQQYITATYQESPEKYKRKVLSELTKLDHAHSFFEVILWFDADLMCQVNLLYLLQKLAGVKPAVISVCTPEAGKSIGYLSASELHQLFECRQMQTPEQLQQVKELWHLYAGPDPLQLQAYLQRHEILQPYLKNALELHFRRFPDCETGLNEPETILLKLTEGGANTVELLMQQFWKEHPGYGFGDWQLQRILERLQPGLVNTDEPLSTTALGKQTLDGKHTYTTEPRWLGGAQLKPESSWCYNKSQGMLIKV